MLKKSKSISYLLFTCSLPFAMIGCGGYEGIRTQPTPNVNQSGQLTFVIDWSNSGPHRMLPSGTNSVLIEVLQSESVTGHIAIDRNSTSQKTSGTIENLSPGSALVRAIAYSGQGGTGTELERGSTSMVLQPGTNSGNISMSYPSGISLASFSDSDPMTRIGSARVVNGKLRLCDTGRFEAGASWSSLALDVAGGFNSVFSFQISSPGGTGATPGADGFAFVLQGVGSTQIGGTAQDIGYGGIADSLAVEFDTYQNTDYGDPDKQHISVHTNGAGTNSANESYSIARASSIPALHDGAIHNVMLDYTPGKLNVFVDSMSAPVLSASVVLSKKLNLINGRSWVGFTAATGSSYQNVDLINFKITSK